MIDSRILTFSNISEDSYWKASFICQGKYKDELGWLCA